MKSNNLEWGKAHSYKEYLGYPVSGTQVQLLLQKNTGLVNLISMDWNEAYNETMSGDTVFFVLTGEVGLTIGPSSHLLLQGNYMLIPAKTVVNVAAIRTTSLIYITLQDYENISF